MDCTFLRAQGDLADNNVCPSLTSKINFYDSGPAFACSGHKPTTLTEDEMNQEW